MLRLTAAALTLATLPTRDMAAAEPDRSVCEKKVIVVNYNPVLSTKQGARLSEHLHWNDPRGMTSELIQHIESASGGYAKFRFVDWIDVNAFPRKRDGFRYTEESYLAMWNSEHRAEEAHQPDAFSYAAMFTELALEEKIKRDGATEIWVWGAPYFGTDEYAMKIPKDALFYQPENPWFYRPYDIPDCGRTVWVMGFNYEVGVDNALHSFGHRCEGVLSLSIGRGQWNGPAGETNPWSRFTRQATDYPDDAQCGNVHGGPNARSGYDYGQMNEVMSGAENWIHFPDTGGPKIKVSASTWGEPHHLNFMKWWLGHLPRNQGVHQGFHNNWWRYVIDYDAAVADAPPPDGKLQRAEKAMY